MTHNTLFVIYDVTRFIATMNLSVFTGIDRVDFFYAKHVFENYDCIAIAHKDNFTHYISKENFGRLIQDRERCMNSGEPSRLNLQLKKKIDAEQEFSALIMTHGWKNKYNTLKKINLNTKLPKWLQWLGYLPLPIRNLIRLLMATLVLPLLIPYYLYLHKQASQLQPLATNIDKTVEDVIKQHLKSKIFYINITHTIPDCLIKNITILKTKYAIQTIFYIHDIIPIDFPEYTNPGNDIAHIKLLNTASNLNSTIICNSDYTKNRIFEKTKLHFPKVIVSYIGFNNNQKTINSKRKLTIPHRPYFVILGTIEGRKNHISLLHIWRKMKEEDNNPPLLYILGKRGWSNGSVLDFLDRSKLVNDCIVEINNAKDDTVLTLLSHAKALLMPSFAEGWGMPVVEALTMGTPVICSDIPVFHEATREMATFIDPLDLLQWEKTIREYQYDESKARATMLARIASFKAPQWKDAFDDLDSFLCNKLF